VFDFRYHALTIVAVFLALLVGLLLGVAIGDKGLVSSAETNLRENLRQDVSAARSEADDLRRQLAQEKDVQQAMYPALVAARLDGIRVGIVALGELQSGSVREVRRALEGTGAELVSVSVIREPLDRGKLARAANNSRYTALDVDDSLLHPFGYRIGTQYVQGGRLLQRERGALLGANYSGRFDGLDAVILERSDNKDLAGADRSDAADFEQGLIDGITQLEVPVVGIEKTSTDPSQVGWFSDRDLASVDDVDQLAGHAALVLALSSRRKGAFGVKPTADAIIPPSVGAAGAAGTGG
jgi:hypothetical protein